MYRYILKHIRGDSGITGKSQRLSIEIKAATAYL
jgi:hypothetical protein